MYIYIIDVLVPVTTKRREQESPKTERSRSLTTH